MDDQEQPKPDNQQQDPPGPVLIWWEYQAGEQPYKLQRPLLCF